MSEELGYAREHIVDAENALGNARMILDELRRNGENPEPEDRDKHYWSRDVYWMDSNGADPTGDVDCTDQLQRALENHTSVGFGPGRFKVGGTVEVPYNRGLSGTSISDTTLFAPPGEARTMLQISQKTGIHTDIGNFKLDGGWSDSFVKNYDRDNQILPDDPTEWEDIWLLDLGGGAPMEDIHEANPNDRVVDHNTCLQNIYLQNFPMGGLRVQKWHRGAMASGIIVREGGMVGIYWAGPDGSLTHSNIGTVHGNGLIASRDAGSCRFSDIKVFYNGFNQAGLYSSYAVAAKIPNDFPGHGYGYVLRAGGSIYSNLIAQEDLGPASFYIDGNASCYNALISDSPGNHMQRHSPNVYKGNRTHFYIGCRESQISGLGRLRYGVRPEVCRITANVLMKPSSATRNDINLMTDGTFIGH